METKLSKPSKSRILSSLFANPKYRGKHVVVLNDKIYVASTGSEAAKIFEEQTKKHPGKTPLTTYIPADNTLIL
jgi:hypothetical protein